MFISDPLGSLHEVSRPPQRLHGLQSRSQKVKVGQGPKSKSKNVRGIGHCDLGHFPTT